MLTPFLEHRSIHKVIVVRLQGLCTGGWQSSVAFLPPTTGYCIRTKYLYSYCVSSFFAVQVFIIL